MELTPDHLSTVGCSCFLLKPLYISTLTTGLLHVIRCLHSYMSMCILDEHDIIQNRKKKLDNLLIYVQLKLKVKL